MPPVVRMHRMPNGKMMADSAMEKDHSSYSGSKRKSRKQVGYLLSSNSPLTAPQKAKLLREMHSGAVTVGKK